MVRSIRSTDVPAHTFAKDARTAADPRDRRVDEAGQESFPASDPPATWAGADLPPVGAGHPLPTGRPDLGDAATTTV